MVSHLRKNFPATVNSETVKKFSLASNNESYLINALQFIGIIDDKGKRTDIGHRIFVLPEGEFQEEFSKLVRTAYGDLFDTRGDDAWSVPKKDLVSYFRTADKTSEVIATRQASVFEVFRFLSGKQILQSDPATKRTRRKSQSARPIKPQNKGQSSTKEMKAIEDSKKTSERSFTMSVRLEINLPSGGSQENYDAIFRSIKANLLNE
jgi:hypothetical protein